MKFQCRTCRLEETHSKSIEERSRLQRGREGWLAGIHHLARSIMGMLRPIDHDMPHSLETRKRLGGAIVEGWATK